MKARLWIQLVLVVLMMIGQTLPGMASQPVRTPPRTGSALPAVIPPAAAQQPAAMARELAPLAESLDCTNASTAHTVFLPLIERNAGSAPAATGVSQSQPMALDPGSAALRPNRTVAADVAPANFRAATEFLYTGNNPIQTGVVSGTIDPLRAAVLRGQVCDRDGHALADTQVTILNHSEYGSTQTQADGMFDLAVNGGELLTVVYTKTGYLPVQRQVWAALLDYAWLPDVLLMPRDSRVTTVDLTANVPMQAAQGSLVSDQDGARRGTLLISQGTQAALYTSGGTTQTVTTLNLRLTEYTNGAGGPLAMPAQLPPASGYTYAIELSTDEAQTKVNGKDVLFSQPVFFYVENFLSFPTGMSVPAGYYDAQKAAWIPSQNGRVVKIIGITNGMADLDTDGDAVADNAPELGITDAERGKLAALYSPGQSLWRVPLTHLSTCDYNWPYGPPNDAGSPRQSPPSDNGPSPDPDCRPGSVIECQNQTLGEAVNLVGTPFSLHYQSDRVRGRKAAYPLNISLSGASVPASLKQIDLEVLVAGRKFTASFPAAPNQSYLFVWDGQDAYGRLAQGKQYATVRVGYVYDAVYQEPGQFLQSFAQFSGVPITGSRARQEVTLWQEWKRLIGLWDAQAQGLGGWSLSAHHSYDPKGRTLYLGDGGRLGADALGVTVINTAAGGGWVPGPGIGDGGPATQAELGVPDGVAVGPDGSLYIAEDVGQRVRRVFPSGIITTVAGTSDQFCPSPTLPCGDGGPATQALLHNPDGVAVGADGSLYIADRSDHRIRRVLPSGVITTVAGTGAYGLSGDDGPATQAQLNTPYGVAVAPDGSLYIADTGNHRVRRVGPDGIINTVAGTVIGYGGDGGPAIQARLDLPWRVALGPDGSLYIADYGNHRVRRVGTDGLINTVAGTGISGYNGDGGQATQAQLASPEDIAVAPDGSLYIADRSNYRVRWVGSDGIISTIAGTGAYGYSGDGGPATRAMLNEPIGLAVVPDGGLYIADWFNQRVRRVSLALPGFSLNDILIPSEDGSQVYVFNGAGRHLRTLHALTGVPLYTFGYDGAEHLTSVADGDGNVTTITRDANGNPMSIAGPYGQTTTLTLDANGYLASITNPANESVQLGHSGDGLLTSLMDARGYTHTFQYDSLGRLQRDADPAGGFSALARIDSQQSYTVALTTALSRTTTYRVESLPGGAERRVNVSPNGLPTESTLGADGVRQWRLPDGVTQSVTLAPDPRWGMLAPLNGVVSITTPGGLTFMRRMTSTATLSDTLNPLSLVDLTELDAFNGRVYTRTYNVATRTWVEQSPTGRTVMATIDAQGRVVYKQAAGLAPATYAYDNRGRLITATMGTGTDARTAAFAYNSAGYLASATDPLSRTVSFDYDLTGRVTHQILPDGRVISYTHDLNGNLASLTPPGRPAHAFDYTPVDLVSRYAPPDVNPGSDDTLYAYNPDRQITFVTRPDGQTIGAGYDSAGRLNTLTIARGILGLSYDASTGNLASVTAPGGSALAYAYDGSLNTGTVWSGPIAGTTVYTYNNNLRLAASDVNAAGPIAYQYDNDSLLTQSGALTLNRDAQNGLLTSSTLGGITDAITYNGFGEAIGYHAAYASTPLLDEQYTRDRLGRITAKAETLGGVSTVYSYTYDLAGRLTGVISNGVTIATYTYDSNGNRSSFTGPGGTLSGVYDAQDRLLQYGTTTYTYTSNGELLSRTNGAQTTNYQYDALGNLITVTLPPSGSTQIVYLIDGQNRRVGKRVNGILTQGFLYNDQLRPAVELDGSGNFVSRFVYATRMNVPEYMIKNGVTYRLILDHLGSPRLVVNVATGAIVQRMDYDEFGRVLLDTNPGFQPFGFAGGLYDTDTGLVRFGARDYDAETGRWMAKDPLRFYGRQANLYTYVLNDPMNHLDPSGLCKCRETLLPAFSLGDWADTIGVFGGVGLAIGGVSTAWSGPGFVAGATVGGVIGGVIGTVGYPVVQGLDWLGDRLLNDQSLPKCKS